MKKLLVVFLSLLLLSQPVFAKPPHLEVHIKKIPNWYVLKWNTRPDAVYKVFLTNRKLFVITSDDSVRIPTGLFCAEIIELQAVGDQSVVTGYGKICKI